MYRILTLGKIDTVSKAARTKCDCAFGGKGAIHKKGGPIKVQGLLSSTRQGQMAALIFN